MIGKQLFQTGTKGGFLPNGGIARVVILTRVGGRVVSGKCRAALTTAHMDREVSAYCITC